jgi:hypothetical protein
VTYQRCGVDLIDSIIRGSLSSVSSSSDPAPQIADTDFSSFFNMPTSLQDCGLDAEPDVHSTLHVPAGTNTGISSTTLDSSYLDASTSATPADTGPNPSTAATSPPSQTPTPAATSKAESNSICDECGYRPEGNPKWFQGSMAKHKKLMHGKSEPVVYQCPYPGCTSRYTNRPDNLRQHQIKKQHFVGGEGDIQRRPSKRKKMDS